MKTKGTYKSVCCLFFFCSFLHFSIAQPTAEELLNEKANQLQQEYDEILDLKFVGGGDFNTISNNSESTNTANLSLGFYLRREFSKGQTIILKDIELDIGFNIASTADTLYNRLGSRDFGNFILNPINQKQSARVDIYSHFKSGENSALPDWFTRVIEGSFLRFYASNNVLVNSTAANNEDAQFTALNFKWGLFHEFMPNNVARKENISILLGFAYSMRGVYGDIVQNNKEELMAITDSTKNTFHGLDMVFSAKFNDFRVEFIVPFIHDGGTEILGLTNTQFLTSFRFLGGFNIGSKSNPLVSDNNTF